jgi:hypothetical protein
MENNENSPVKKNKVREVMILVAFIIFICIAMPAGYFFLSSGLFKPMPAFDESSVIVPPAQINLKVSSTEPEKSVKFVNERVFNGKFDLGYNVYVDGDGNNYYLDSVTNKLVGAEFKTNGLPASTDEKAITKDNLKEMAYKYLGNIIDMTGYVSTNTYFPGTSKDVVITFSKMFQSYFTCDSAVITMQENGTVSSFSIRNSGFFESNKTKFQLVDKPSKDFDEKTAQALAQSTVLTYVYDTYEAQVVNFTKSYSILEIDKDLKMYWKFTFETEFSAHSLTADIPSVYSVKINAVTKEVSVNDSIDYFL